MASSEENIARVPWAAKRRLRKLCDAHSTGHVSFCSSTCAQQTLVILPSSGIGTLAHCVVLAAHSATPACKACNF